MRIFTAVRDLSLDKITLANKTWVRHVLINFFTKY